ncbi:MAG: hypothetical protein WBD53_06115 [Xanthobacteraceae bacterium]
MARCHYSPVSISAIAGLIGVLVATQTGFAQTPAAQTPAQQAPLTQPQAPQVPATAPQAPPPPAATQVLSAAQTQKINGWITDKGRDIAVTPIITDILGLTNGNQTLTCRAFATAGDGGEVHQIYVLPDGKGYLEAHFYKDRLDVYWADKNFALLAAVEGVRGQKPTAASFADAQYGFDFESAWWAKYADAH